jgi:hypothetical protein
MSARGATAVTKLSHPAAVPYRDQKLRNPNVLLSTLLQLGDAMSLPQRHGAFKTRWNIFSPMETSTEVPMRVVVTLARQQMTTTEAIALRGNPF